MYNLAIRTSQKWLTRRAQKGKGRKRNQRNPISIRWKGEGNATVFYGTVQLVNRQVEHGETMDHLPGSVSMLIKPNPNHPDNQESINRCARIKGV